jgi:D-threo-aldose 1-dehydrogenase
MALQKVTIGTTWLGGKETAGADLADAMLASEIAQIDTSNVYAQGQSETFLGDAIRRAGGLPPGKLIFSKADPDPETGRFDGDRILRSWEETTTRLGLETLPIYHLHDPYDITLAEAMAPGGPVAALTRLRDEGLIGAVGIAAGTRQLMEDYVATGAFDAVLTHNRFTLVDRSAERILQLATERGMTVFNAAPFGGGLLAGSDTRGVTYGYKPASEQLVSYVRRLHALCADVGVDVAAAALQFSMAEPRIHSTVVGIYSIARLEQLPGLIAATVPDGFWDAVAALGTPPASPND